VDPPPGTKGGQRFHGPPKNNFSPELWLHPGPKVRPLVPVFVIVL
jgi:hypothetical protein